MRKEMHETSNRRSGEVAARRIFRHENSVVDNEALEAAQKNPELHKDLIVRTGGYSALFVELDKETQNSIIARTEHAV